MKKLILLLAFVSVLSYSQHGLYHIQKTPILIENDSLIFYRNYFNKKHKENVQLFIKAYKYDRLVKYYAICKRKPSQWKYYKGWSIRVFEQK
jgi:hypothetical protein